MEASDAAWVTQANGRFRKGGEVADEVEDQGEQAAGASSPRTTQFRFSGRHLYAAMIGLFGAIWLLSGNFVDIWQSVSDTFPGRQALVYASGLTFLVSAGALAYRPTARMGSIAPILVFLIFVWRWVTRIIVLPAVAGTWSGCGEEFIPVIAAVLILAADPISGSVPHWLLATCRILFGLFAVAFGLVHFEALQQTAEMVPGSIPGWENSGRGSRALRTPPAASR